jgi:polyisoprenoid-binding protein YceI
MKILDNKILMVLLILISGYGFIAGCTHKNEPVPAAATTGVIISHGKHVFLPGLVVGDTTQWKFDKVHSNVTWATPYLGIGSMLTGRFNQFGIANVSQAQMINYTTAAQPLADTSWAFYENEPAKTHFSGYVQINQSNTGEPGRDNGCNITTLGTTPIVAGTQNLTVSNIALIKTTSVAFDPLSNAYIVKFNLTWQGKLAAPLTQALVGKLVYVPRQVFNSSYSAFGLSLQFQFNCRDFGIASTSIADKVNIEVNVNFNNK